VLLTLQLYSVRVLIVTGEHIWFTKWLRAGIDFKSMNQWHRSIEQLRQIKIMKVKVKVKVKVNVKAKLKVKGLPDRQVIKGDCRNEPSGQVR